MADLALYEVPHRNHKAVVKMTAEEAKALYGDNAKKVGEVKKAEPQPVARPPWDTAGDGEAPRDPAEDSSTEAGVARAGGRHEAGAGREKMAGAPRNKAR